MMMDGSNHFSSTTCGNRATCMFAVIVRGPICGEFDLVRLDCTDNGYLRGKQENTCDGWPRIFGGADV